MAGLKEPTKFAESIDQLGGLADTINLFKTKFEDLQRHVDFIHKALDAEFDKLNTQQQQQQQQQPGTNASLEITAAETNIETTPHQTQIVPEKVSAPSETTGKGSSSNDNTSYNKSLQRPRSEIHHLCLMMSSRGLRKYMVSHLSEIQSRREEAISALELAPKPAKLVLECVGRFFLQGIRAYTKGSPMIVSRQASVLVLELFLTVIGKSEIEIEIDRSSKQEAENNAIAWKKRLVSEGGVGKACEIDARGLLLFIACFGIPKGFKNDEVRDLIRFSNLKEIGHLLKGSHVLLPKIPEIVENMKKNRMLVEAVDVLYAFGIENKFSPYPILTSFLGGSNEAWQRTKQDAPISQKKEANEKHLAALQSVIKCLEDKNIDPAKLLPGWQIRDKIVKLEKEIADLNKQIMTNKKLPKRHAGEIEPSNYWNSQESKRCRFTANGSTLNGSFLRTSPHVFQSHDPRHANYANENSSYDGLTRSLSDGGFRGYINSNPVVSAALHVYNTGSLPDDVLGPTIGGGSMVNSVADEVRMSPGIVTRPTGSATGVHAEPSFDKLSQAMHVNGSSYGCHRAGDTAYDDRVIGQSFTRQPVTTAYDGLHRPSPSIEHFAGPLDPSSISGGNQKLSSDLYSFADAVL